LTQAFEVRCTPIMTKPLSKGPSSIFRDIARYLSSAGFIGFRSAFQECKADSATLKSLRRHEVPGAKG
jgi:hypothetical protein